MSAPWQANFVGFSALVALQNNDHEAMFDASGRNPTVEQIGKAQNTDHKRHRDEYQRCSSDARSLPELSDAIDRAREMPVEAHGVVGSFWYSNCGRRIQRDRNPGGRALSYDDRLKEITIRQWVEEHGPQARLELARRERDHDLAARVAEYGGSPVATVVVYSPRGIGNREFLVSQGWTRDRVVRYVTRTERIPDCFFCSSLGVMTFFVKVDCGGVRRVFPMCVGCEPRISRGFDPVHRGHHDLRIDVEMVWDDWDRAVGWPDDKFR